MQDVRKSCKRGIVLEKALVVSHKQLNNFANTSSK